MKCSTWKWANGTKCYCKTRESGKALDGWVDLSDASRQDLQGDVEESGGSETKCVSGSASSLGVRGTHTAGQGCYLPVRPSSCPDFKNPDGHWKGGEYLRRTAESKCGDRRKHSTKAQDHLWELQGRLEQVTQRKEEEDQGYDFMDLQDGPGSWWEADLTRFGRRRTCSGVIVIATVLAVLGWISLSPTTGVAQVAGCNRGFVDQVCRDAAVHWQHHDAVQCFPGGGHVGDSNPDKSAEAECAFRFLWPCPGDAASFNRSCYSCPRSKRPAGDKADRDDSPRKFMVGADDDDLLIDQLGQPLDLQPDLAQESL